MLLDNEEHYPECVSIMNCPIMFGGSSLSHRDHRRLLPRVNFGTNFMIMALTNNFLKKYPDPDLGDTEHNDLRSSSSRNLRHQNIINIRHHCYSYKIQTSNLDFWLRQEIREYYCLFVCLNYLFCLFKLPF